MSNAATMNPNATALLSILAKLSPADQSTIINLLETRSFSNAPTETTTNVDESEDVSDSDSESDEVRAVPSIKEIKSKRSDWKAVMKGIAQAVKGRTGWSRSKENEPIAKRMVTKTEHPVDAYFSLYYDIQGVWAIVVMVVSKLADCTRASNGDTMLTELSKNETEKLLEKVPVNMLHTWILNPSPAHYRECMECMNPVQHMRRSAASAVPALAVTARTGHPLPTVRVAKLSGPVRVPRVAARGAHAATSK